MKSHVRLDGRGWFVIGLITAALVMPVSAVAATSIVKLGGGAGNTAYVNRAHQLLVAENDPKSTFVTGYLSLTPGVCRVLKSASSRAMIVRQLRVLVQSGTSDSSHGIVMVNKAGCAGSNTFIDSSLSAGSTTETFDPGLPVPAGDPITLQSFGSGLSMEVEVSGYFVPANAVR
jgi:hypothetical protein